MTTGGEGEQRALVFRDRNDDSGVSWRRVALLDDGRLEISGHDLGKVVESFWGCCEYEFSRRLTSTEVSRLCELLGVEARSDLLTAIAETFSDTSALERFLELNELPGQFWSRVGD